VPARILAIATRNMQPKTPFLLIQRLMELETADADQDPYKDFGFITAGGLFRNRYHPPEIIDAEAVLTLFARTVFEYGTLGEVIHVLPIIKVVRVHFRSIYSTDIHIFIGFLRYSWGGHRWRRCNTGIPYIIDFWHTFAPALLQICSM